MTYQEFYRVVDMFESAGLQIKTYPQTYLINAQDCDGVWQSYYASTGTAVFRDGNDKYKSRHHTERHMPVMRFIQLCKDNSIEDIQELYFE